MIDDDYDCGCSSGGVDVKGHCEVVVVTVELILAVYSGCVAGVRQRGGHGGDSG